jgi:hypothetical protein
VLDVNLAISGSADRLVITGPIGLANATLAGFNLAGKLSALSSGGTASSGGDTTQIEALAATIRMGPDGIRASNFNLVAPAIGALTGDGTVAPAGALDFRMLAKLTGGGAADQVSRIGSLGQPVNGVPFRIQGTTANPVFVPDVGRAVHNAVEGLVRDPEAAKKAAGAFGGLFGKKK